MKLFEGFEAVRFPEEDLLFVTRNEYLYYIYNPKYKNWRKHRNAGNDHITVSNYQEVSREEIIEALGGVLPKKETDFLRCCHPSQLRFNDLFDLLEEDYWDYMSEGAIYHSVRNFLLESVIPHKSYLELKKLFKNALSHQQDIGQVLNQIKELCYAMIGRDIFKPEIGIVDGHDTSSYFWIMPVRVVDYTNTSELDSVARMKSAEISIEEGDVNQYLVPFLYKYFDSELEANKMRLEDCWVDDDVSQQVSSVISFEWYLTHNFYTYDSVMNILRDIYDTIDVLSSGRENEYTVKLKEKRGSSTYELLYSRNLNVEQIKEYNANRPKEDNTEIDLIIDFYHRFIYRMEYMMRVGKEKGFDLISFMGP